MLHEVSEATTVGARQVANEGDYWFMSAVRCVNTGVRHTKSAIEKFGFCVYEKSRVLKPRWLQQKSQRERIRRMLLREAKRSKAKLSGQEFELFSEQIAA